MSSVYDYEEVIEKPRKHRHHHHEREVVREVVRDDRSPRYTTTQETYVKKASPAPVLPNNAQYVSRQTELIRRPAVREDSVESIEEIQRDFLPPGSEAAYYRSMEERRGSSRRARSVERDEYDAYARRPRGEADSRKGRQSLVVEEKVTRRRSLSRNQKIIAAVGGAALAVGGKELWDRRQAAAGGGSPHERNVLGTAAVGAAGAFAAYEGLELYSKHGGKVEEKVKHYAAYNGKDGPAEVYYSTDEERDEKPKKSRRKSIVEGALGLMGASAAAKALTGGGGDRDRDRDRSGRRGDKYDDRSRSRTRKGENVGAAKLQQAAKAALLAGAVEAFRVRKEPGGWGGAKAQRILTAAIGSGAVDAVADNNPDKHSKRHILESVIGGLAANRAVNGSRKDIEDDGRGSSRGGRSRSRSRSRGGGGAGGGLAALATAAAAGLAGKKLLDNRSRSRSRRRRSPSEDSYDSRSPHRRRGGGKDRNKRSKSVTDFARKGLAAIGLGDAAAAENGRSRDVDDTRISRKSRYSDDSDSEYDDRRSRKGGNRGDVYGDPRYADSRSTVGGGGRDSRREKDGKKNRRKAEGKGSENGSSSDLGSSSGDEKARRKMKGKQMLTAGLATVATIHAAHNVYASMEKRKARQKAVAEGEMSPEEAKKLKSKATMQDMASIGIAALGIKGAVSEWKEMQEMRHEYSEFCEKKEERHKKRIERQQKSKKGGSSNAGGRRRSDNWENPGYPQGGPRYIDDNPYGALPPPPAPPMNYGYGDR